jgi:hypothetical protein
VAGAGGAGGCSCEARRASPPSIEADRILVPGAGAPGAGTAARPPGEAAAGQRTSNPPLLPQEGNLAIEVPPITAPGVETTALVRLTANAGYEINEKFHYKLTLEPTSGVTLRKAVFTEAAHDAERLDARELAIAMKLTPDKPGDYTIRGKLDFAVCKVNSQCLPKTMPVAVQVAAR